MIELQDVVKIHRRGETEVHALRGVTGCIQAERMTFLVGPSGSGKSTLLYLIGALDAATSGTITVAGRRLADLARRERDQYRRTEVGFIFQSFNLLANLTAVENVLVPHYPGGGAAQLRPAAIELLNRVGLGNRLDHRPSQLSGGEQQRVAVARALLKRPRLILADEPTGELDSQTGEEIFQCLREVQAEHRTTVVVVTHDRSHIRPEDVVLTMRDGRLAAP